MTSDRRVWETQRRPAERYDGFVRTSRYVALSDGIRLATDLYLPEGLPAGKRVPTILILTPYIRSLELEPDVGPPLDALAYDSGGWGPGLSRYGYAVLVVESRGAAASFGRRSVPARDDDGRDDVEIVDWVITQPWSNGLVGATGISAPGMAALNLLTAKHPAVRAVAPLWTSFDVFAATHPGGLPISTFVTDLGDDMRSLDQNRLKEVYASKMPAAAAVIRGLRRVDEDPDGRLLAEAVAGHVDNYYVDADVLSVTYRDEPMPQAGTGTSIADFSPATVLGDIQASGAAVFCYAGWFDGAFCRDLVNLYRNVRDNPGSKLLIGPWGHGGRTYTSVTVKTEQRPAEFEHAAELACFFDAHLRDEPVADDDPPVRYFTMGADEWRSAQTWPLPRTGTTDLYLDAGGALSGVAPDAAGADPYRVDFEVGSGRFSRWARSMLPVLHADRADVDQRLLTYTGPVLGEPLEVTGHPLARLYVESSAPDFALIVYLEDVAEDGTVRAVTEGLARGMFRSVGTAPYVTVGPGRSYTQDESAPVTPGEVVEVVFDLLPLSYVFPAGHRVRVAVAGADADQFARVPASGDVTLTVHRGAAHRSVLELPTVGS